MDEKIVFVRTSSGEDEARSKTALLSKDIKRALLMVDGAATVAQIKKRSSPSLRVALDDMFAELARDGFIQDKARAARTSKLINPALQKKSRNAEEELDFTAAFRVPTKETMAEEAAKLKAADDAREEERRKASIATERARLEAAEARNRELIKAEKAAAEAARIEAERQAKMAVERVRMAEEQAEKIKAEAQDRARVVAEEKARLEAEVAKLKAIAEAEARARAEEHAKLEAEKLEHREATERARAEKAAAEEAARRKADRQVKAAAEAVRLAEQHAEKVKAEAQARASAIAEEKDKLAAEVLKLKAQADAQAQARAEERTRQDAERIERREAAARVKAEKAEAEEATRLAAERQAQEAIEAEKAKAEARVQAVAEEKARLEAEVARLRAEAQAKAEQEAERIKAEQEAERIKAEQEAERIKAELEAERIKAEQEAERIKAEQEAERIKAEQDAERIKAEQEAERVKAEQEAERIKAEQEAERVKAEAAQDEVLASVVRLNAQHEANEESVLLALNESVVQMTDEHSGDAAFNLESSAERRLVTAALSGCDSRGGNNGVPVVERRTTTAAVLFLDIAEYTKQPDSKQLELKEQFNRLLTGSLASLDSGERIALDTGDGAAIGFLQHPADALESAVRLRTKLIANKHFDYPELRIRVGIHLGPVSLVKDMNGQINMLGDGINSAQRVMSFAGLDQILVSRAYFDFVSSMSDEYDDLFRYRGSQKDKHGREYRVYELIDGEGGGTDPISPMQGYEALDASAEFNFEAFDVPALPKEVQRQESESMPSDVAEQLLMDTMVLGKEEVSATVETEPVGNEQLVNLALEGDADPYAGSDAAQLADAQAKKWLEAEQRAIKLAKERAENTIRQHSGQSSATGRVMKRHRMPWGKMTAGLLVLCVLALFVVPLLLPMQDYAQNLEKRVGATLKQPVHIGRLSGRILPSPQLVLSDVSIGDARQIQVSRAQVNFSLMDLFGAVKPVSSLDLYGVKVKGSALQQVSSWLQQIALSDAYPVMRITLAQGKLDAEGLPLSDAEGELDFSAAGKFTQAHLNAMGHKLGLDISAAPQKLALSIALHDSALPFLPNWTFDDLKATGELGRDELRITDLDSRIKGGGMTGNLRVNWRSGWRVQGELIGKVVPLERLNKLLIGDMDGTAHFQAQAENLSSLADAALFNGMFEVKKGMIGGVDIVESTRLRSQENLPGGRTHFDKMSGELFYAKGNYRFSKINIRDSVFQANGAITVAGQTLSGRVVSSLTMRAGMTPVMLQVSGSTDSPALRLAN